MQAAGLGGGSRFPGDVCWEIKPNTWKFRWNDVFGGWVSGHVICDADQGLARAPCFLGINRDKRNSRFRYPNEPSRRVVMLTLCYLWRMGGGSLDWVLGETMFLQSILRMPTRQQQSLQTYLCTLPTECFVVMLGQIVVFNDWFQCVASAFPSSPLKISEMPGQAQTGSFYRCYGMGGCHPIHVMVRNVRS